MQERINLFLSPEEVAKIESEFKPGQVPESIWYEHLRLNAIVTVEITPYKIVDGQIMIYMEKRPERDRYYPDLYHMPGTMVNGSDEDLESAINRVKTKEVGSFITGDTEQIAAYYRSTPRGKEGVFQYLMQVYEGGSPQNWFNADNLPENTIPAHKEMIALSVARIRAKGQKRQIAVFE